MAKLRMRRLNIEDTLESFFNKISFALEENRLVAIGENFEVKHRSSSCCCKNYSRQVYVDTFIGKKIVSYNQNFRWKVQDKD